jgi:catechol 2,3-dioxygenase-like lactoylglutathione lyase family enzyme
MIAVKSVSFSAIDHVQLAAPRGCEEQARKFYVELLGMDEIPKPSLLATRGGVWFASGVVQIHIGVEENFQPARKAHPALRCRDYDGLLLRLRSAGVEVNEVDDIPGIRRAHTFDPFGNRLELIAAE